MRKTNYHMHTKRCMHASGTDEEYVKKCIYDKDMYQKLIYIQQETNEAFNIEATPLLFINGEEYYGYKTSVKLKTIIDSKL